MSRRRISQREARTAIKRVQQLESLIKKERDRWFPETPGEHLGKITWTEPALVCEGARIARNLGFAVVAVAEDGAKTMRLYAVSREKI